MKTIDCSNGNTITTPWLTRSEASAFLGVSEATFSRLQKVLPCPHGGTSTCPRYLDRVLTEWFNRVGDSNQP